MTYSAGNYFHFQKRINPVECNNNPIIHSYDFAFVQDCNKTERKQKNQMQEWTWNKYNIQYSI